MSEISESMQEQFNRIMRIAIDIGYNDNGGCSDYSYYLCAFYPEKDNHLWNIIDGLPTYIWRWLNNKGSISWILENTPEVVEKRIGDELDFIILLEKEFFEWKKLQG